MFLKIMNLVNKLLFLYKSPLNSEIIKIYILLIILFKNINQKKIIFYFQNKINKLFEMFYQSTKLIYIN